MIGIYKVTSPTGEVYIGQSINIERRWMNYTDESRIEQSIKKHGRKNHEFKVLHELPIDVTQDIMDAYEKLYIESYRDIGAVLMNITDGGKSAKLAESTRLLISQKLKGRKLESITIERRMAFYKKNRHPNFGKKISLEERENLSKAHIGVQAGEKHPRRKLDNAIVSSIYLSSIPVKDLAQQYGVTIQSIYYIKKGKTWSHITQKLCV